MDDDFAPTADVSADPAAVAADRLGDPDALYAVSPGRFWTKLGLGLLLVAYGFAAVGLMWAFNFWRFDHYIILLIVAPPLTGVSLLRHLHATRGLRVLVYPTGLLRVQRADAEAYPWDDVAAVGLRAEQGVPMSLASGGTVTDAWLAVPSPLFRITTAGLTVVRSDGVTAALTPALADYPDLAERVQRATFRVLWPGVWDHFRAGGGVAFGAVLADPTGLTVDDSTVPWEDGPTLKVSGKNLVVAGKRKKLTRELAEVVNPHLLVGLVEAVRLNGPPEVPPGPAGPAGDADTPD